MTTTLAVLGAGTMGRGIAQLAAQSGLKVILFDVSLAALKTAEEKINAGFAKGVARGKLSVEDARAAREKILYSAKLADAAPAYVLIEAIVEDLQSKQRLFRDLDAVVGDDAVLATNTSSISVGKIAEAVRNPERVVGMHFFNPPVAMKLVEIIRHPKTSDKAFQTAARLAERMRRTPVEVKDTTGFLVNRVLRSYYLVAQRLAAAGAGTFKEIDAALKAEGKVPMGPFELMDFIGLEVNLKITHIIYEGLGKPEALKPHEIQEKLVAMGCRGRKGGGGFYIYGESRPVENPRALELLPTVRAPQTSKEIFSNIMTAIFSEAERVVKDGVASEEGVDTAVRLAMNFPQGPFAWKRAAV